MSTSAAAAAAAAAAATAASLAAAKGLMDTTVALVSKDISYIQGDIKDINASLKEMTEQYPKKFITRIDADERRADDNKLHDSFDKRLRFLERYAWAAIGALGLLEAITKLYPLVHIGP